MKAVKLFLYLVIAGSLVVTGLSLVKVIEVQGKMGKKQAALLEGVEEQNSSIEDITGAFTPTEEMTGKTRKMLEDLKSLVTVVEQMNVLVDNANALQGITAEYLDRSNAGITGLKGAVADAKGPLSVVAERTSVTLSFINRTVGALGAMAGGLASTNGAAADIANMMQGRY